MSAHGEGPHSGGAGSGAGTLFRFLIAGGINTAATLALYWVLLPWVRPHVAYALSFLAGIVLSYLLNTTFVFRVRRSWGGFLAFPLVYAVSYAVGALVLQVAIGPLGLDARLAPLLSIIATVPTTYLLSRAVLRDRAPLPPG